MDYPLDNHGPRLILNMQIAAGRGWGELDNYALPRWQVPPTDKQFADYEEDGKYYRYVTSGLPDWSGDLRLAMKLFREVKGHTMELTEGSAFVYKDYNDPRGRALEDIRLNCSFDTPEELALGIASFYLSYLS